MGNLETGVDPCVGTTSTDKLDRMVGHSGHGFRQLSFNRAYAAFLELPTVKAPPIVFKGDRHPAIANSTFSGKRLRSEKQKSIRMGVYRKQSAGSKAGAVATMVPIITDQESFLRSSCASTF